MGVNVDDEVEVKGEADNAETLAAKEEDAAFLAEMAGEEVDLDTDADEVPDDEDNEPADDSVELDDETDDYDGGEDDEDEATERVEVIPGYTAEELRESLDRLDKLQKAIDTTNGRFGSKLEDAMRRIESLQQRSGSIAGHLHPDVIKRLEDEFPELAELLKPDDDAATLVGSAAIDPAEIERIASEKVKAFIAEQQEKEQARELRALTKRHSDWRETAMYSVADNGIVTWNNPQFGAYVASLPVEDQNRILSEWDAEFIGDVIDDFKATLAKKPGRKNKRPSLDNAVRPKGTSSNRSLSPEDEEEAAFRAEMKKP